MQYTSISTVIDFYQYSMQAKEFAIYPSQPYLTSIEYLHSCTRSERTVCLYPFLGLVGEAGEVLNKLKKCIRDNEERMTIDERQSVEIIKELGDVLWYVDACARELGVPLRYVAEENIRKLYARRDADTLKDSGDER